MRWSDAGVHCFDSSSRDMSLSFKEPLFGILCRKVDLKNDSHSKHHSGEKVLSPLRSLSDTPKSLTDSLSVDEIWTPNPVCQNDESCACSVPKSASFPASFSTRLTFNPLHTYTDEPATDQCRQDTSCEEADEFEARRRKMSLRGAIFSRQSSQSSQQSCDCSKRRNERRKSESLSPDHFKSLKLDLEKAARRSQASHMCLNLLKQAKHRKSVSLSPDHFKDLEVELGKATCRDSQISPRLKQTRRRETISLTPDHAKSLKRDLTKSALRDSKSHGYSNLAKRLCRSSSDMYLRAQAMLSQNCNYFNGTRASYDKLPNIDEGFAVRHVKAEGTKSISSALY